MKNKIALSLCLLLVCGFTSAMRKKNISTKETYQKGSNVNVLEQNLKIAIEKKDDAKIKEFIKGIKEHYKKNKAEETRAFTNIKRAGNLTDAQAHRLFVGESIHDIYFPITDAVIGEIPTRGTYDEDIIDDGVTEQPSPVQPTTPIFVPPIQQPTGPQPTTPVDIEDIDELYIEPQPQPQQGQQQQTGPQPTTPRSPVDIDELYIETQTQPQPQPPVIIQPEPVIEQPQQPQQGLSPAQGFFQVALGSTNVPASTAADQLAQYVLDNYDNITVDVANQVKNQLAQNGWTQDDIDGLGLPA